MIQLDALTFDPTCQKVTKTCLKMQIKDIFHNCPEQQQSNPNEIWSKFPQSKAISEDPRLLDSWEQVIPIIVRGSMLSRDRLERFYSTYTLLF